LHIDDFNTRVMEWSFIKAFTKYRYYIFGIIFNLGNSSAQSLEVPSAISKHSAYSFAKDVFCTFSLSKLQKKKKWQRNLHKSYGFAYRTIAILGRLIAITF